MPNNAWVNHGEQYAATNKLSYGCALSLPDCKSSYKSNKKEPTKVSKTKKTKEKEEVKPAQVYTMYKSAIGPVKPAPTPVAAPKKALDKSTIKKMLEMSMKEMSDHVEPKIKIKIPKSKK
jgi:hypothetical protein